MNAIVQLLNTAGRAFVDFAVPMLVQSSLLILILLVVDAVLRKRVRAVFRYWIWMLVLVKLVLPPSLWSPVSVGMWLGDKLEVSTTALLEAPRLPSPEEQGRDALATRLFPAVTNFPSRPRPVFVEPPAMNPAMAPPSPLPTEAANSVTSTDHPPALSLNWQGLVLLVWMAVVTVLLLLLAQRTFFVQGLVAQGEEAGRAMLGELDRCRQHLGLPKPISLRLSPNAASPAICGLLRPVILIPRNLASRLHGADLQAVLFHELAHLKRGDLWVNLIQTLLQIVYFYNPLLWLANTLIRRIREKAVDETVLVALGADAPLYPETLVNVAKLAFARRPTLSLRLIGVVESKSALTGRIQHILSRPFPKTARLGLLGLLVIFLIAAILLPMAAAQNVTGSVASDASQDSDGDGLSDYDEIHKYLTDPAKKDSDGDGTPDGDWSERREYTYSVRTVLRYLPPVDEKALNDDFQDGRVLKQTDEYIEVEVIHYPLATGYDAIPENRNWRQDDTQMREYLAPGATTNWDESMRRDLIAALKADGIDVETLSDKQVVEQVSRWLLKRSRYLDKVFTTWYIHFPQGKPTVYPGLEDAFRREFERDKSNYDWTIDQHFDHEVLGKGMFYNKTHGSCTSTAVYLTTVLRALGIPTRMVLVAPAVDASDREQILMVMKALTHNRVRETMLAGLRRSSRGFTNHTLNEVYVGGRWRRLDYSQLGRPAFGVDRFGLQTHLYTVNDLSDVNLAATWGVRYGKGEHNDLFQHDNPYSAVEVSELFGAHGAIANPPFSAQESSSSPLPNIFLMSPGKVSVWDDFIGIVKDSTWDKTGRPHAKEYYDNLFEGLWTTKPGDILVLLFSPDTPERIPAGYEDLLPKPWPEIESQLQQGQTVELGGEAREKNVILLAAPTADGLKPLVQNSKLLRAISGASPAPSVGPTQAPAISPSAAKPVRLANGATVELLGVCEYPSAGKQWWRPDGATLDVAPYQTTRNKRELQEGFRDYELVVRYGGAPDMDIEWSVPGARNTGVTGSPFDTDGQSIRDLTVCTVRFPKAQPTADVRIGVAAGSWETPAVHRSLDREGTYSLSDNRAVAFGIAHFQDGRTLVPVTKNFSWMDVNFRVVAVDEQGEVNTGSVSGAGGNSLDSLTYLFDGPLSSIKELRVQTRPWKWVDFKNVTLRPDLRTEAQTEPGNAGTQRMVSRQAPGQGKVVGLGPAWEVLKEVLGPRYWGSIGGFSSDPARTKQYFDQLLARMSPGDTFVLMFAFDQPVGVPPEHADLLPLPWAEIESRVKKGQPVEAQGQARDLTVIVLAAPTSGQLDALVRQTHLLDPYRPEATKGPTVVSSSQTLAQLPNGAAVELLGIGPYPLGSKPWWRPDGSELPEAPYDGIIEAGAIPDVGRTGFWLAARIGNLPGGWEAGLESPDTTCDTSDNRPSKAGQPRDDLRWLMVEAEPNQTICTVRCNLVAPWQTLARSSVPITSPQRTPENGVVFSEIREGFVGGRVTVSGRDSSGEGVSVTLTGRVGGRDEDRSVGVGDIRRVVAITKDGKTQTAPSDGLYFPEGAGKATAYFPRLSLAGVQEFQFQVRPLTRVEFKNVPLRRDLKTDVRVNVRSGNTDGAAAAPVRTGQERRITLRDDDPMLLDLATGELVRMPPLPPGTPTSEIAQAIRKMGRGDLLYDSDLGDHSLILMRGASSEQAQGNTGDPLIQAYLIGPYLPEVLTVKTAEGRQYQVTILAADDKACTLKYSPISPGKGALELRIAPRQNEVEPSVVEEYRKALAEGHTFTGGRYVWRQVQPGTDLGPFVITQTREGTIWLLAHDDDPFIMVPAQGWKLARVGRSTDANGRPMVTLEFDDAGAKRLLQLTKANDGRLLAEIVFGLVVSAPMIRAGQGGFSRAVITGNFTDQEVDDLIATLRRYMVESPTQGDGSSSAAPSTSIGRSDGGGAPAEPAKAAGPLEFLIAPKLDEVGSEKVQQYQRALAEGGPAPAGDFAWFEVRPGTALVSDQITYERGDKTYLLLWNDQAHRLLSDQIWRLEDVRETPYEMGNRAITLTMDETGVRLLHGLADKNLRHYMAVVFESRVIAIPFISTPLAGRGVPIIGRFTPEEIDQIITTLKKTMPVPTPPPTPPQGLSGQVVDPIVRANTPAPAPRRLSAQDLDGLCTSELGVWNMPFIHYNVQHRPDDWWVAMVLLGEDVWVKLSTLGLTRDTDPRQVFERLGKGDVCIPEQDAILTLRGTIITPLSVPQRTWQFEPLFARVTRMRVREVLRQVQAYRASHPDTQLQRSQVRPDETYALLRPDGLLTALEISGPADSMGVSFVPLGLVDVEPAQQGLSGQAVDPNGNPVAGAQVALCTKDKGVDIQAGQLLPTKWGGKGGETVKTDAQGRFSFPSAPEEFHLIAAHNQGFAWVTNKELAASGDLRLEPWGRIEGTLKIGRELGAGERISLQRGGNRSAADQNIHLDYETYADSGGRFTFARVPPTWMEVGYMIHTGDSTSSDTGRTPIHLLPGQNLRMTLGGEGRPVVGKFVPPPGYKGTVYFGEGLRALATARPDLPTPANYSQMTKREQQQWREEWNKTPEAEAYYDALWHDLNRRHYSFRIQDDGTFRIEDVIPGRYKFTVWLEERLSGQGRPEEIGAYYGTIEVPAIPGGRTDEPLDLGNLTVGMRSPPLHVGYVAPLFEAKTLDGKDIRLADYRGRFVLLSFWQPTFHPELDRLKELYQTYGSAGKLAIVDFAGGDTLEEVKEYLAEHKTEWPEIYLGQNWNDNIVRQYGDPSASYILLVDPEGKIVATWLRGEKLTQTVKDAIGKTG